MDKYMNDVKISESVVLDELWAKAFGERRRQVPVFKDYAILVSAPNTYLLPGEKYTANIMLGAYNKTSNNLTIRVNGSNVQVKDGIATYTATANGKGEQTINVAASYTDPNEGTTKNYTSKASYFVGEGQASISLDKMNVFYIGVPNPITFSASGVPAGSLKYSAENCTLTPVEGVNKYVVNVTTPGAKAKISLSGKRGDGTSTTFGTWEYRIKRIPDPYPVIAGKKGGSAVANELKVQDAIIARLDYFDFDAKFSVTSFTVTYLPRRGDPEEAQSNSQYLSGPNASPSVSAIMAKLKPGDKIFFENIKAIGPDKTPRSIGSVNFICNN
jgi:gliding motility-associated protein GldM